MPNLRGSENSPYLFSRYCGINFGFLRSVGFPSNAVDYLCQLHDDGYEQLIRAGKSYEAYFMWNKYDEAMLKGIEKLLAKTGIKGDALQTIVTHVAHNF